MSKIILCADDSVTMQKVAEITFKATEYQYVGAKSAAEALAAAKQAKPAIVLADAVMPGQDGYELCKALKSDPATADVPVLVMCGKSLAYDEAKGSDCGADGHVIKPWDTQVMADKIAEILGQSGAVAKPSGAGGAAPTPIAAAKPAAPVAPARPAVPSVPSIPAANPAAARSATIMGMPTIKTPMNAAATPGVTPIKPAAPAPAPVAAAPKPAAPASPATPATPAATPAAAPASAAMSRAPMIKGLPTKQLRLVPADVADRIMAAAAGVASEAGIDPNSPEMQALMKLSADVIERIAWEVVPQLAEHMLRANLSELAAKQ